jgi:hypothetical protein
LESFIERWSSSSLGMLVASSPREGVLPVFLTELADRDAGVRVEERFFLEVLDVLDEEVVEEEEEKVAVVGRVGVSIPFMKFAVSLAALAALVAAFVVALVVSTTALLTTLMKFFMESSSPLLSSFYS